MPELRQLRDQAADFIGYPLEHLTTLQVLKKALDKAERSHARLQAAHKNLKLRICAQCGHLHPPEHICYECGYDRTAVEDES